MEAYTDFAYVYDTFMDETPYSDWCSFLIEMMNNYGISKPTSGKAEDEKDIVLDIGCGTGTLTRMMYEHGYDMIGIDNSQDMLSIAMKKKLELGQDILYLLQDMRELELYGTIGTAYSVCDSLNYILEEEELLNVFKLVANYLHPGGIFIFDFNTVYKYRDVIGDTTIAENRDECSFIWDNYYHDEEQINEYEVTVFVKVNGEDNLFKRFTETHYQRGYTITQMKKLLELADLEIVHEQDADTHTAVTKESERVYLVAKSRKQD